MQRSCTIKPKPMAVAWKRILQYNKPWQNGRYFWGFIKLLDSPVGGSPTWCVLEHSDLLLDDSDGNGEWETMREALGIRGFKTRPILVDSVYFAVPMHRRRSYLVCRVFAAFIGHVLSFDKWMHLFDDLLAKCRRNPPCRTDVLLKPGNKHIEYEFNQTKSALTDSEFQIQSCIFQVSDYEFPNSRRTVCHTFMSLRYIIHDMHFFDIHNIRASEFQIPSFRFQAPEICIHVFEIHNTTFGSSCHLLPKTCDIHSKVFYSKNIRWGSTECNQRSQQSSWFCKITERQRIHWLSTRSKWRIGGA